MAKYAKSEFRTYKAQDAPDFAKILQTVKSQYGEFNLIHVQPWDHAGKIGYELIIEVPENE